MTSIEKAVAIVVSHLDILMSENEDRARTYDVLDQCYCLYERHRGGMSHKGTGAAGACKLNSWSEHGTVSLWAHTGQCCIDWCPQSTPKIRCVNVLWKAQNILGRAACHSKWKGTDQPLGQGMKEIVFRLIGSAQSPVKVNRQKKKQQRT